MTDPHSAKHIPLVLPSACALIKVVRAAMLCRRMRSATRVPQVMLVLLALSTVLFWGSYTENQAAMRERQDLQRKTVVPVPLNGLKVALRGVSPQTSLDSLQLQAGRRVPAILFVVRDPCPTSQLVAPQWREWILDTPHTDYVAIVASIEGTRHQSELVSALTARRIATTSLMVTQVHAFAFSTGVTLTPTLLAIDRSGSLRVVGGLFNAATRAALERILRK